MRCLIRLSPVGGRAEQGPAGHAVLPVMVGRLKGAVAEFTFDHVRRKLPDDVT